VRTGVLTSYLSFNLFMVDSFENWLFLSLP